MVEPKITQIRSTPGMIDLGLGDPDLNLLPVDLLGSSAEAYFKTGDPRPLQYGLERGNGYFRRALADFLSNQYEFKVDPNLLFITAGASSGIDLICTLFTRAGDVVFVEEPSYFLALRIFKDHGLKVVSVPMDTFGMDIDALQHLLTVYRPKFIYTIPVFQNPSGRTLSGERRIKLVDLAQEHDFLVLADEAYQFLSYFQDVPSSFAGFTGELEQVVSINSFSKILAPGLRLGWIQAHRTVIERLSGCGLLDSGGGMSPFTSALVVRLVEAGGLEENIAQLRREYSRRLKALDAALREHLPEAEYQLPRGGFFFWVKIRGLDAAQTRLRANQFEVDYRPGNLFSSQDGLQEFMRLGYCFYQPDELENGIIRLRTWINAELTSLG